MQSKSAGILKHRKWNRRLMNLLWLCAAIVFAVEIIVAILYYLTKPMPPLPDYVFHFVLAPSFTVCLLSAACEWIVKLLEHDHKKLQPYVIISVCVLICAILMVVHHYVTVVFVVCAVPVLFSLVYNSTRILSFAFFASLFLSVTIYVTYFSIVNPPELVTNLGNLPANIAILFVAYLAGRITLNRFDEIIDALMETEYAVCETQAAKKRTESASNAKSRLVANMSHTLQTPMEGIVSLSEQALGDVPAEHQKDYLHRIKAHAEKLSAIIRDVLDVSQIEAGDVFLAQTPFDLHRVLHECEAATAQNAAEKGLRLYFYNETKLSHKIIGDPVRLRQVLLVFLSNAVKYTGCGSVTLVVKQDPDSAGTGAVKISFEISDTGAGMTEERRASIFEPFHQAHHSGSAGLGLCVAKNFIEAMGGSIDVKSIPDIGSRFSFTLSFPLSHEQSEPEARKTHDALQPPLNGEKSLCGDGVTIDDAAGIEYFAGNKQAYMQALETFAKRYAETPALLTQAAKARDFSRAQKAAHTEKGAAAIIGARRLSELLTVLEEAFRRDGLYFNDSMIEEYQAEHAKVLRCISGLCG